MEPQNNTNKWSNHQFVEPKKRIISVEDVEIFKKTKTFHNFMTFLQDLQKSVESKPISATPANPKFATLVKFLEILENLIIEIPPLQQKMRYGNKAFRTWHERVQPVPKIIKMCFFYFFLKKKMIEKMLSEILPVEQAGSIIELKVYFLDSFGSYERIDYGTGLKLK
jgi:hypothetical protein